MKRRSNRPSRKSFRPLETNELEVAKGGARQSPLGRDDDYGDRTGG